MDAKTSAWSSLGNDNNLNAKTMGQLATVVSADNVRLDTGEPGKLHGAPSLYMLGL
jgi:hypothetical protein